MKPKSGGTSTRGTKVLVSVAAPLESDSDDEFNVSALTAEAEASYKTKKRSARGRPSVKSGSQPHEESEEAPPDPLPMLLGFQQQPSASSSQSKLADTWRGTPVSNTPVSADQLKSDPATENEDTATEDEDTATESETDEEGNIANPISNKRPSEYDTLPTNTKRPRTSPPTRDDSSATESESSSDESFFPSTASTGTSLAPSSLSRTPVRPTLLPPTPLQQSLKHSPKPLFPPPPQQAELGPLQLNSPDSAYSVNVPASINRQLREYQRDGVRFFHQRWAQNTGGILGDDMGLGKTIQVIAFLSAALRKTGDARDAHRRRDRVRRLQDDGLERNELPRADKKWGTCLIICPKTVVGNWERELDTWGYFEYATYAGDKFAKEDVLKDFKMGRLDIVLAAFETARINIELLSDLPWSMIFVDEVHRCKNPTSGTTIALHKFSCRVRFGLTGTAIQNGYKELWTLLDWCAPGKVGSQNQWKLHIGAPLAEGQAHRATQAQVSKARLLAESLVKRLLPVFFLRRTKALIADQLPRKFDQVVFCPLAKTQLDVYKRFLESPDVQLMVRKDEPCDCSSGRKRGYCCYKTTEQGVPWKDLVLKYMQLFVELSNHVMLIVPGFKGETDEQRERRREYVKIAFPGQKVRQADLIHDDSLCGKWKVLAELLDTWRKEGDNKVLIFSKSVRILEMLEDQMKRKNITFCCMDGKTKQEDRMAALERFNNDPNVFAFLISTLVGGTGLNMTSANKVVIFDPNWNPAHDLQAMDRAYRFGQKRDVNVYRLLGAGALEELVYARQIYKQQQMQIGYEASVQTRYFDGVQGAKAREGELFGLKNIFKLHETALATKMTIEKANLAEVNWALANMDSAPDGTIREHGSGRERTLADFMLDYNPCTPPGDPLSDILNAAGVAYSHNHQDLLMVSHVEKNITTTAIAGVRRADGEAFITPANEGVPVKKPPAVWPPRRKAAKQLTPENRLQARVDALIELGLLKDRDSLAEFARDFARKSDSEQKAILLRADRASAQKAHKA